MADKTRIGIVGVGRMGSLHTRFCAGLESVELAALCDIDESRGREAAERHGCAFCADFHELAGAVDAVVVSVPTKLPTRETPGTSEKVAVRTSSTSSWAVGL